MTKMNWSNTNKMKKVKEPVHLDKTPLFGSEFYKNILKHEELVKELSISGDGLYKISLLESIYQKSGFKTKSEFEDYFVMDMTEKQKEARHETCIYTCFSGGKYKGFSYKEVWKAKPDYILWVILNAKNNEHRKRVLQNIDLAGEIHKLFEKYD